MLLYRRRRRRLVDGTFARWSFPSSPSSPSSSSIIIIRRNNIIVIIVILQVILQVISIVKSFLFILAPSAISFSFSSPPASSCFALDNLSLFHTRLIPTLVWTIIPSPSFNGPGTSGPSDFLLDLSVVDYNNPAALRPIMSIPALKSI